MRTPSPAYLILFWILSNVVVLLWLRGEISEARLPGYWRQVGMALYLIVSFSPFALILYFRKHPAGLTLLGLLVCSCLALSLASNETNQLRSAIQTAIDSELAIGHSNRVEGIIRPLIARIVETYVWILGDDKTGRGTTYFTYMAINYMFDSASLLAVFALATILLSPIAAWLCLFIIAFFAQTAIQSERVGEVFIAGGFFWQLFLLASGRNFAAILSGLIMSFMRTDLVFATSFAVLGMAWAERRWPSGKEWSTFGLLVVISLAVPKILLALHPEADFSSFLLTHGDYFTKLYGNYRSLKFALGVASPVLVVVVATWALGFSRLIPVIVLPALIHLSIVLLIADFSEARLLGPALGGLAFLCSERLGYLLEKSRQDDRTDGLSHGKLR